MSTIVDTTTLAKVIGYALATGIGVTVAFSLAIFGGTRFADLRREGRDTAAGAFAVLAGLALAVCLAAIVGGIIVMTTKG